MITFEHVTKIFPTGQSALSDVTFHVDTGEFVFVTGESGAGKTTLMKLLTKEYLPTEGIIVFDESDLSKLKKKHLPKHRREIGVVFQDYKLLFDRTVAENIALAFDIIGERATDAAKKVGELLELVGLSEKAEFFPKQLSGGEAQRVSIARALATSPKLLFADEPTGNLDLASGEAIVELFRSINSLGTTVFMATHNVEFVNKHKARELHLHKGKLVKDTGRKEKEKGKGSKDKEKEKDTKHEEKKEKLEEKKRT